MVISQNPLETRLLLLFVNIGQSLAKIIPKCKYSLFTQFLPDTI